MKRLLAQTGITYFSVLAVAFYVSDTAVVIIGAIGLTSGIVLICIKKTRRTIFIPAMAFAAALACTVNIGYTFLFVTPEVDKYADSEHAMHAVVIEEPYKAYSKYYYRLRVLEADGERTSFKLLLKTGRPLDADPDDALVFSALTEKTENDYFITKGYYLVSDVYYLDYEVDEADNHSLYYHAVRLRRKLRIAFDRLLPSDCASLCKAVFVGDKYALDLDTRESFRYAGVSYFIVISGMHFAVLCMLLFRLLRKANRWLRLLLVVLFIGVYMAVTGFQPSVMRSGVMTFILVFGMTIRRQTYSLNHLGAAGFILSLLMSPYAAGDAGLILSFYATMSILLWAEPISKKICVTDKFDNIVTVRYTALIKSLSSRGKDNNVGLKRLAADIYNRFAMVLSVGLAANILVFPISVFLFGAFSLVTLLSSVLLYWAIYLIVILSLFVSVIFLIMPLRFIAAILAFPLLWLCRYVLWTVGVLSSLPFAYVKVTAPGFYLWLILTIILGIWVITANNGYKLLPKAAGISAVILTAVMLIHGMLSINTLRLEVYECREGLCAGVNSGGRLYLISMDAYSSDFYNVLNLLSKHYAGAQIVLCKSEKQAEKLADYSSGEFAIFRYLLYDSDCEAENVISFDNNSTFFLDDGVTLHVAVSGSRQISMLEAGDRRILLLPPKASITDIPDDWLDADTVVMTDSFVGAGELSNADTVIGADTVYNSDEIKTTREGDIYINLR